MTTNTFNEQQKLLIRHPEITVRFHGTPHEAVLFVGPFHSLLEWRASHGNKTQVQLELTNKSVFPLEKLFGGHFSDKPFEQCVDIFPNENENCLDDLFKQVMRPSVGSIVINDFHQNKSLGLMEDARRRNPASQFISSDFPVKVLILPPVGYFNTDAAYVEPALWERMWSNLIPSLIDIGCVCYAPKVEFGRTWNRKILPLLRGHIELKLDSLEAVFEAILSSSIVIACQSELSSLSSVLYVPTLTIYANTPKWERYQIKGKAIPSFSCPMNQTHNVSADYVIQAVNRIQGSLLSIR